MTWDTRLLRVCSTEELFAVFRSMGIEPDAAASTAKREHALVIKISAAEGIIHDLSQILNPLGGYIINDRNKTVSTGQAACVLIGSELVLQKASSILKIQPPELCQLGMELDSLLRSTHPSTDANLVIRDYTFRWGERTYVMGIVNATPDSFSGDGLLQGGVDTACVAERAALQGLKFVQDGADILDVGGESTRPGARLVEAQEELERIVPAIRAIREKSDIPISIDTSKAQVAEAALDAGADMINDISGLSYDNQMAPLAATRQAPVVLMHIGAGMASSASVGQLGGHFTSPRAHSSRDFDALMANIIGGLRTAVDIALQAGIAFERLIVDPGIGFNKIREENLYVVNHLDELKTLGLPILLGVSRKAFIGYTLNTPVNERVEGTAAAICVGITRGANIIRVHDVIQMVRVARMTDALVRFVPPLESE